MEAVEVMDILMDMIMVTLMDTITDTTTATSTDTLMAKLARDSVKTLRKIYSRTRRDTRLTTINIITMRKPTLMVKIITLTVLTTAMEVTATELILMMPKVRVCSSMLPSSTFWET